MGKAHGIPTDERRFKAQQDGDAFEVIDGKVDLRAPVRARLAVLGWTHAELARRLAALIGGDPDSRERTVHRFLTVGRPIYTDVYEAMLTVLDLTVTANDDAHTAK